MRRSSWFALPDTMSWTIASLPLMTEEDVVSARLATRRVAELLGFDSRHQTHLATAVSEIARNAFQHGGGGELSFRLDAPSHPTLFSVVVHDHGPGIADVDGVLQGRRPGSAAPGTGLPSAQRLVHRFELQSTPGEGTCVTLSQRIARSPARLQREKLRAAVQLLPGARPDPLAVVQEQHRELIQSLSDLSERESETLRLRGELEETNRGVVALYTELDEKAEQLRSVSDLKSRFLSHMSHEFRTPLNSILALSRLLLDRVDGDINAEQERQVEYIRRSAQSLLEMVNDLLDLAKVEAGKLEVRPAEFTVAELFGALRGSLKPLQTNPAVELVFEDANELPQMVADEAKVAQVLRNFISNALKFTEAGQVVVSARWDAAHQRMHFAVSDTGIGIPPENLRMIFEEFTQIEHGLQRGGTGLGLPLSQRLATLMGGEVGVRSSVGQGSTFTLVLPLRWGQAGTVPADGAHRRVLLVDDEEPFRYVLRHIAEAGGFGVLEAADGAAGLEVARAHRPDVIVLDLQMPRMNGFEMLAALSRDGTLRDTPVIVCTSLALDLEQKRSLAAAHAIVSKHDISRDALTSLMRAALGATQEEEGHHR
jgi:signal transduction histidine kinase/CheY-like chemotaxis protein